MNVVIRPGAGRTCEPGPRWARISFFTENQGPLPAVNGAVSLGALAARHDGIITRNGDDSRSFYANLRIVDPSSGG